MRNLLPLMRRNLRSCWSPWVVCTDASEWGLGAMRALADVSEVAAAGRIKERWRWRCKDLAASCPRAAAALAEAQREIGDGSERAETWIEEQLGRLDESGTARKDGPARVRMSVPLHPEQYLTSFPEVSSKLVQSDWRVFGSRGWRRRGEHIVTLEGRAIVFGLKHELRSTLNHGARILMLTDSMSCAMALSKGRSSKRGLCRISRIIAAHVLSTGSQLALRWIASELNPADAPSRRGILVKKGGKVKEKKPATHARSQRASAAHLAGHGASSDNLAGAGHVANSSASSDDLAGARLDHAAVS